MSDQSPSDKVIDPRSFSFGVVAARYNESLVEALLERVTSSLCENGQPAALVVERVPGSHEIPSAMSLMIEARPFSCLVGLGVVIKGVTSHHHLVAESAGHAFQSLVVRHGVPIINGLVVTEVEDSAAERITGRLDRGREFAKAALEMAQLREKWTKT
jgi:6,7-dimethyl-8-ribityllumazine synthase